MSSSPSGLFFAGKVLEEEVDLMSSSPSCLFFCWKCSWGRGRLNVVLLILPDFAGGYFVSSSGQGYCIRLHIIKSLYNILHKKYKINRLLTKIIKHYTYSIDMIITQYNLYLFVKACVIYCNITQVMWYIVKLVLFQLKMCVKIVITSGLSN